MLRPLVRCAGGKTWLLPQLLPLAQAALAYQRARDDLGRWHDGEPTVRYHEPFAGGAALALALAEPNTHLVEYNAGIAALYQVLANECCYECESGAWLGVPQLAAVDAAQYAQLRAAYNVLVKHFPQGTQQIGALYWLLNHLCFNGLHRENAQGEFNTPFGNRRLPAQPDWAVYRQLFRDWLITHGDGVAQLEGLVAEDDPTWRMGRVIYADPPYDDTFSSYTSAGFNKSRQAALAAVLGTLVTQQGASVIATNADTPFIRGLYEAQGFQIATLQAPRRIAANPEKRTDATELLMVRNVPKEAWDEICHSIGSPKSCSPSALTSMA